MRKLPSEIQDIIDDVKKKQEEEQSQEIQDLVEQKRIERTNDKSYWDVPIDQEIEVFDPTLSYEITGYRPIDEVHGLDFNPEWFIETRKRFETTGKYCDYLPRSKRWDQFWKEEYRRCRDGYTVNGYTLTGDNYFFLNFYQLPVVDLNKASGEGTNEGFPIFLASQYVFFHYLQMCRILHKNAALMKARSIGFSEINAALAAKLYTVVKKSRTMITCYNDKFLTGTFNKVQHALTFINTNADGFFKPRLINKALEIKSGYQTKIDGQFTDAGWQSSIVGVNGSKPSNIRGDRVDLLIYDESGCHAKGTQVIMYSGTLKKVEDIKVGDILMGDDGTPRNVLELHSGKQQMYKIIPKVGDTQIVNANHILYGKHRDYYRKTYEPFTIRAEDYYNMVTANPRKKDGYKLIHSSLVKFPHQDVLIEPYLFGFWLGDGDSAKAQFTSEDPEIINYLTSYGEKNGFIVRIADCTNTKKCKHITFTTLEYKNKFCVWLKQLGVFNNKHIPDCYLYNDEETLLQLLAGIIDSDGTYDASKHCVQITQYEGRKHLVDQIEYICHLLGMRVSRDTRISKERYINGRIVKGGVPQYRINILWGHSRIPTKLPRKQTTDRDNSRLKSQLDRLDSTFTIEKLGIDEYYGFSLDGNQLFLLKDFTVCHNSWPNITTAIVQGQELCEVQGIPRGIQVYGGTGGDFGPPLEGLKKIYYNPKAFKVLPYRHNYTQDGLTIDSGFFIPYFAQSLNPKYMDNRGVCKIAEYKKALQEERNNLLAVPEEYLKKCAERCWNAEEAFTLEGQNKFNKIIISEQLVKIRLHKLGPKIETGLIDYTYKNSKHTMENINGFRWIPNAGKVQILEHPVWSDIYKEHIKELKRQALDNGQDFEAPVYNKMDNLYVAGIDGIDIGAGQTSKATKDPSDFCITIKKRAYGLNDPQYVAIYKDRPNNIREAYKIAMCLCKYYNCKINIEATRVGMLTWARENKCLGYFMKRPRATLTDIKYGTSKSYGTPATKTIIEQQTDLIADFVEDYGHTIWFPEMLDQLNSYNDENKTKFDIIAALGMTELADQELSGRQPRTTEVEETEQYSDFGYYIDEYGHKKFGVIPKQQAQSNIEIIKQDDTFRIETSDPRIYEELARCGLFRYN